MATRAAHCLPRDRRVRRAWRDCAIQSRLSGCACGGRGVIVDHRTAAPCAAADCRSCRDQPTDGAIGKGCLLRDGAADGVPPAYRYRILRHLYMVPLAWQIARLKGAPLIIQMHGIEAWTRPPRLQRVAAEGVDLMCAYRVTTIAPERILVVPNTVADVFAPGTPRACARHRGLTASGCC
jgi:hypothetical protein